MITTVPWAMELAQQLLAEPLPRRWAHTQGVAAHARSLTSLGVDLDLLETASWLHDIGYSPSLVATGLHSLDGARHLRELRVSRALQAMVAHHSCATFEAEERGFLDVLVAEFPHEAAPERLHTALTFSDMTTGPDGEMMSPEDRLAEILQRYPSEDPVHRAIRRASPSILGSCRQVSAAMDMG